MQFQIKKILRLFEINIEVMFSSEILITLIYRFCGPRTILIMYWDQLMPT